MVVTKNKSILLRASHIMTFAKLGSIVFSENSITIHPRMMDDGRTAPASIFHEQKYITNGRRCFGVKFSLDDKKERRIRSISVDPKQTYEAGLRAVTRQVRLDSIVSTFGPTSKNIVDLLEIPPSRIVQKDAGATAVEYVTEFGVLTGTMKTIAGRERITEIEFQQKATDVYTHLSNGSTLADVREAAIGAVPEGLISASSGFRVIYSDHKDRPFDVIVVHQSQSSANAVHRSEFTIRLVEYRKCNDAAEIEALKIPIPDGEHVNSVDPEYQSLALSYQKGDVVRQVDGAALQEFVVERRSRGAFVYVPLTLLAIIASFIGFRYLLKRLAARRGNPA